jgi:hypothetical protein
MEMRVPVKGWTRSETVAVWLVDWAPGEPELQARLCAVAVAPIMGVQMTFSPGLAANLPLQRRPVRETGEGFEIPAFAYAFGVEDDDRDGQPGVAASLSIPILGRGEMSLVQEATLSLRGERGGDGVVRGSTVWSQTQRILSSTRSWLDAPLPSRDAAEPGTFTLAPTTLAHCP